MMNTLRLEKAAKIAEGPVVITLCQNERILLPEFFQHYRNIGIQNFIIVDDRSNDGSFDFLIVQPDCTVLLPTSGSTYAKDKRKLRKELLDEFCEGRWVVLPDIDEHLVWIDNENMKISNLIEKLESDGDECAQAVMLDMYSSAPLNEQKFSGSKILVEELPFFDDDTRAEFGYRLQSNSMRFRRKWPTPSLAYFGGMRERLFFRKEKNYRNGKQSCLINLQVYHRPKIRHDSISIFAIS